MLERLLRYVRIDTQSDRAHRQSPSTPGQLELARLLVDELLAIGLADAAIDANGFVTATLAGQAPGAPVIGLLAHLDTSPDESGRGVEPLVHRNYDGGMIELPRRGTVLDPARMPELTAQGRARHRLDERRHAAGRRRQGRHGRGDGRGRPPGRASRAAAADLKVAFTPDEEIGEGAHLFDIEAFGALCAYTFDGSEAGEFTDETFTAASADLTIPASTSTRPRHGQARQRRAPGRPRSSPRCRRTG